MNRFQEFYGTCRHWVAINRIAIHHGYFFPFHDVVKGLNILLLGDRIATKLHRRFSRHHLSPTARSPLRWAGRPLHSTPPPGGAREARYQEKKT